MDSEPLVVQALYSYSPKNNDELCFKKGDFITITQKDEGWWEGTFNDKTGWFPSNYVKEAKDAPVPIIKEQNQYKSVVLKDLIDSEKAHVTELVGLVTNFLQPLESSPILTSDEYKQLTGNINEVLETHQQLLALIESEATKPGIDQRVGRIFLTWSPRIKSVHQAYCALHPRAVCILDKYKDELTKYMEARGAASPGVLVLTTMLSKPFRRLDKYSGMMQELERHVEESHPDRGDTQRSVDIFKDIASSCAATRRQKELELQVLTGPIRGWEGPPPTTLGEIIFMGSVAVGPQHADRYYVLFPTTLVILSVSHRLSAFIFEGKLYLSGITVARLDDSDQYKNAFEISAPMIDKKIAVCQSKEEASHWVELLSKHMTKSPSSGSLSQKAPLHAQCIPHPPPHKQLNQRGYSNRTSILNYRVKLNYNPLNPPETYPATSPYAALTRFFHKKIKQQVINTKLLKNLLYSEYLNKMNLNLVKIRHHKSECIIVTRNINCRDSVVNCDSDSSDSSSNSKHIRRQNAVDSSKDSDSSSDSDSSNPFGYIRYYNPQTGVEGSNASFIDYGGEPPKPAVVMLQEEPKKTSIILTSSVNLKLQHQLSETSGSSSGYTAKPSMTCIDLRSIDDDLQMSTLSLPEDYVPATRRSCPTKLVGNKFNASSLTTIYIPTWSNSDNNLANCTRTSGESSTTHSSSLELPVNTLPLPDKIVAELLYNFDGEFSEEKSVIKPPAMFDSDRVSLSLENIGFRKHSINSDKPKKRRSSIQIEPSNDLDNATTSTTSNNIRRCVSSQYLQMRQSYCECCCHSPRSSDSGMAGSCTLNSPDLALIANEPERSSSEMTNFYRKYNGNDSDIEARDFESQCQCTSPFGSTPRTSCQPFSGADVVTGSRQSDDLSPKTSWSSEHSKMTIGAVRSQSVGDCSLMEVDRIEESAPIYRSGLYAHWWLKAKIPAEVVRGIYEHTRSPVTDVATSVDRRPTAKHAKQPQPDK